MGLFDELKKIGKEVLDNIQNAQNEYSTSSTSSYSNGSRKVQYIQNDSIPSEFDVFPTISKAPNNTSLITSDSYKRCSMNYSNISYDELSNYTSELLSNGYTKNSNVRFDKGNTYIIVDYKSTGRLNLVFHIKS